MKLDALFLHPRLLGVLVCTCTCTCASSSSSSADADDAVFEPTSFALDLTDVYAVGLREEFPQDPEPPCNLVALDAGGNELPERCVVGSGQVRATSIHAVKGGLLILLDYSAVTELEQSLVLLQNGEQRVYALPAPDFLGENSDGNLVFATTSNSAGYFVDIRTGASQPISPELPGDITSISMTGNFVVVRSQVQINDIPQVEAHAKVIDTRSKATLEYLTGGCPYSWWDAIAFDDSRVLVSGCFQPMVLAKPSDGTTVATTLRGARLSAPGLHDTDGAIVLSYDCPSAALGPGLCRILETGETIAIATEGLPEHPNSHDDFEPDYLLASDHHFVLGPEQGSLTTVEKATGTVASILPGMTVAAHAVAADRLFYAGTDATGGSVVGVYDLMNGTNAESSFREALTELVALRE